MTRTRLHKLVAFFKEIEKLKHVERRVLLANKKRWESTAEHSWSLAMWTWLLLPDLPQNLDSFRVLKLVLMHDLVEIYAGDTFLYDTTGRKTKEARENKAAQKLFRQLPADFKKEFHALWEEFEAGKTPEAKVAKSMDRLQPIVLNILSGGVSWKKHRVTEQEIHEHKRELMRHNDNISQLYDALIGEAKRAKLI